jgi:glycosyltransferase involved in cell wall biosynthesis
MPGESLELVIAGYRSSSSGIATFTYELSKALAKAGHSIYLISWGMPRHLKAELTCLGVEILDLGRDPVELELFGGPLMGYQVFSKRVMDLLEVRRLKSPQIYTIPALGMRSHRIPLVFCWNYTGLKGLVINSLRGLQKHLKIPGIIASTQYIAMDSMIFRRASWIGALTRASHKHHSKTYGGKVIYIPPPISVEDQVKYVRRKTPEKIRILFVSRDLTIPRKNFPTLINALKRLDPKYLERMELVLVGARAEKYRGQLERLRSRGLRIYLTGYVPRDLMSKIYRGTDLLIHIPLYEELGYVVLEAMAHGLAVIASNIPTLRDMVLHKYNGFLVDPERPEEITERLASLLENIEDITKMGLKSIEIAIKTFNPDKTAGRIGHILKKIL